MIKYAEGIFTSEYTRGDKKLYATFHPEVIIERKEYALTGRYLVVLLYVEKGLQSFFLNKNNNTGKWEMNENDPAIVDENLLEWSNEQITSRQ